MSIPFKQGVGEDITKLANSDKIDTDNRLTLLPYLTPTLEGLTSGPTTTIKEESKQIHNSRTIATTETTENHSQHYSNVTINLTKQTLVNKVLVHSSTKEI